MLTGPGALTPLLFHSPLRNEVLTKKKDRFSVKEYERMSRDLFESKRGQKYIADFVLRRPSPSCT